MAADSTSSSGGKESTAQDGEKKESSGVASSTKKPKRYAVDVRLFLLTITTAMACAFFVGVMLGPNPSIPQPQWNLAAISNGDANEKDEKWTQVQSRSVQLEPPPAKLENFYSKDHEAAGQHLLIDIKNVQGAFLDSEERLTTAMVDIVEYGGLTMLSYHCHKLQPSGISCVGILLESHISFHTWPQDGVITLDMFTCGANPLLPLIPKVKELFGIGGGDKEIVMQWSHELRGFRSSDSKGKKKPVHLDADSDLSLWILSPLELHTKKQIVSTQTPHQRIDIWDLLEVDDTPSHEDAKRHNLQPGDPRWLTPELATPERLLFLDGTLQSLMFSEHEFHEALVHPAMFAHPGARRVALIGGGEGATLREVLKHKTVEQVTMIEIDETLVNISRIHLPSWSDCSDLEEVADYCLEDERATVIYQDGREWFINHYGKQADDDEEEKPSLFDVIVIDALDPEDNATVSEKLYNDETFIDSLMSSLTDEGVIVVQVGDAPSIHDPRADIGIHASREVLFNLFENHADVEAMMVYEEPHCGFLEPRAFLLVCKSASCRGRWNSEIDAIDYQIYDRIIQTESGKSALMHYDGATHHHYRTPPKAWETIYCRREPTPFECAYVHLDPDKQIFDYVIPNEEGEDNAKDNSFKIEWAKDKDNEEISKVFATVDIPRGSYIMPTHLASSLIVSDVSLENLEQNTLVAGKGKAAVIEDLLEFIDNYGHASNAPGMDQNLVEIGASFLIRQTSRESEANICRWVPSHPSGKRPVYSPVYERHRLSFDVFVVASRDITAGEEIVKMENMWEE